MGKKNIGGAILDDLKALPKKILKPYYKNGKLNANRVAIDGIPFVIIFYVINKYVQAAVSADGGDMLDKCVKAFSLIFQVKPYFAPSFNLTPIICGIGAGVAFKLFMNSRKKNAKQFRPREEYGSAKWGTDKDFEPYTDPVKWNNIPLTATEWLRMTRPEHPKYDRNKNILIVGGSGAGKTRGFVKPSLMQMQCSYVVTDPKGTVLEEVGAMLARGAWELDDKGNKVPKVGKNGQTLKTKSGKVIYKRTPYKIKVFNTINFAKSMHYNPWDYIPVLGNAELHGDRLVEMDSVSTCTYGFLGHNEESYMLKCKIMPREVYDHFGILLKSDKEASGCLLLEFDVAMQRVSLVNLPMGVDPFWVQSCQAVPPATEPGPDGVRVCEKTFDITEGSEIDVKIIVDHDMVEVFVGEQVAFTYRIYAKPEFETGLLAQDARVEFYDIEITGK